MNDPSSRPRLAIRTGAAAACAGAALPSQAAAHVKWFCTYDVATAPRSLSHLVSADFGALVVLTLCLLLAAGLLDRTPAGTAVLRAFDRVLQPFHIRNDLLLRGALGSFFLVLWADGSMILTPELKSEAAWTSWLQLGIAVCLISRRTMAISAAGIIVLFSYATWQYCVFHLLDYPIFVGVAAWLLLSAMQAAPFGVRPLDVLRHATAVTLMWASVEKWAYPEWSLPLLLSHPKMTMGFDYGYYMNAAGLVEFALAFALACGPLMRRTAAIILTGMFASAILEFGRIDAIGHAPIIAVLVVIASDNALPRLRRSPAALCGLFCGSLAATILFYYGVHAAFYGAAMG